MEIELICGTVSVLGIRSEGAADDWSAVRRLQTLKAKAFLFVPIVGLILCDKISLTVALFLKT